MLDVSDKNALTLLNANKSKYIRLGTHFNEETVEPNTKFNILVDLNKLFEGFRRGYQKPLVDKIVNDRLDHNMGAEIMNWVGHYKRFFERLNCQVNFYLFYGYNGMPDEWDMKYNTHKKYLNFIVEKRVRPIAMLAYRVFIVNANNFSAPLNGLTASYLVSTVEEKRFKKSHNIIISDDQLAYQLLYQIPNSLILKVTSDNATIINNAFDYLAKGYKTSLGSIPNWLINVYLCLMGVNDIPPISEKLKKLKTLQFLADNANTDKLSAETVYSGLQDKIVQSKEEFIKEYNKRLSYIDNLKILEKYNDYNLINSVERELQFSEDYLTNNVELVTINNKHYGDLIDTTVL